MEETAPSKRIIAIEGGLSSLREEFSTLQKENSYLKEQLGTVLEENATFREIIFTLESDNTVFWELLYDIQGELAFFEMNFSNSSSFGTSGAHLSLYTLGII